jgi:hypothetical protein
LNGAIRGSRSDPKMIGGLPLADTIAHPTNGCASINAYNVSSEPTTSLCSTLPTVTGSLGARWVNLFAMRNTTMHRISTPSVMWMPTNAEYDPSQLTITNPMNNMEKIRIATSQCRIRVRSG